MGQSSSGPIPSRVKVPPGRVQCARLPADGSVPHIVTLRTVDIHDDNNVDAKLYHIPDCRSYWPTDTLWQKRAYGTTLVKHQPEQPPQLEGTYYIFKTRAIHGIPANKHLHKHIFGDIFIAKVTPPLPPEETQPEDAEPNDEEDADGDLNEETQEEGKHEGEGEGEDGEHQGEHAEGDGESSHEPKEPEAMVEPEKPVEPEEVKWKREWPVYENVPPELLGSGVFKDMIRTMVQERFWYE